MELFASSSFPVIPFVPLFPENTPTSHKCEEKSLEADPLIIAPNKYYFGQPRQYEAADSMEGWTDDSMLWRREGGEERRGLVSEWTEACFFRREKKKFSGEPSGESETPSCQREHTHTRVCVGSGGGLADGQSRVSLPHGALAQLSLPHFPSSSSSEAARLLQPHLNISLLGRDLRHLLPPWSSTLRAFPD